jgi:hypothetical protein
VSDLEWPWPPPGFVRRDCEPHRGRLLLALATVSLVCGVLAWCLVVPCYLGLPAGLAAYLMARDDMRRMRAGLMDHNGWGETEMAWSRSIDGLVLNIPGWVMTGLALFHLLGRV